MYEHKYGTFADQQMSDTLKYIRKKIFYLLLYVDPKTKEKYLKTDINKAFSGLLYELGGMNSILFEAPCVVTTIALLEEAMIEYQKTLVDIEGFDFPKYRKLILDAGNEILKIEDMKVPCKVEGGE